ncbi:MAG: type II secretion system protein N [Pseudomonadota bacterium]
MRWVWLANTAILLAAGASLAWAGLPVARHMAGIVAIEAPESPAIQPVSEAKRPDIAAIIAFAPFGAVVQPDTDSGGTQANRPALALRGVFASKESTASALLDVDGEQGLYRLASTVSANMRLDEIAPAFVRLSDSDGTLTLYFDGEENHPEQVLLANASGNPTLLERMSAGLVVPQRYERPGKPETTAEYIDYWRQRLRKNPKAVLDEIGLEASDKGYVIAAQHDIGVSLAGLRSGDLVRSVNGQPVGNPDTDRRLYDQIAASGHARLEVERGGRVLSFSFPLR